MLKKEHLQRLLASLGEGQHDLECTGDPFSFTTKVKIIDVFNLSLCIQLYSFNGIQRIKVTM